MNDDTTIYTGPERRVANGAREFVQRQIDAWAETEAIEYLLRLVRKPKSQK